ncbi:hypothetical protein MNBD_IGNAVI01-254 [hydrothermal vent metagenome]|uniref:Uncharacterized protein n=1 Tax=hydrothermal vent metagenome TaxID=652676 RepID=A0A3B1C5H9_9ZZZZ
MEQLTKRRAIKFLKKYFSLFVNNYKKSGYKVKIILAENSDTDKDYFYVQFCKGKEHTRDFKIIYH